MDNLHYAFRVSHIPLETIYTRYRQQLLRDLMTASGGQVQFADVSTLIALIPIGANHLDNFLHSRLDLYKQANNIGDTTDILTAWL